MDLKKLMPRCIILMAHCLPLTRTKIIQNVFLLNSNLEVSL